MVSSGGCTGYAYWFRFTGLVQFPHPFNPRPPRTDSVKVSSTTPAYELVFEPVPSGSGRTEADVVRVYRTEALGSGGHPIYVDAGGTVRAEISDRGEVRMLATSARQVLRRPTRCRALACSVPGSTVPELVRAEPSRPVADRFARREAVRVGKGGGAKRRAAAGGHRTGQVRPGG